MPKRFTSTAKSSSPAMSKAQSSCLLATVSYEISIQALASSMSLRPATRNCQSSAKSLTPESICMLNAKALQLHLDRHNLPVDAKNWWNASCGGMQPLTRALKLIHMRAAPSQILNPTTLRQYPEARTTVSAQIEAITMGK